MLVHALVHTCHRPQRLDRQWVDGHGLPQLTQCIVESAEVQKGQAEEMSRIDVTRIERHRRAELTHGTGEIEVEAKHHLAECPVRVGKLRIQRDGFPRERPRALHRVIGGDTGNHEPQREAIGQPRTRERVVRIARNRLLEERCCPFERTGSELPSKCLALQEQLVRHHIHRRRPYQRASACHQVNLQRLHDGLCDFLLHLEHVGDRAVEGLPPDDRATKIHQLHAHLESIP